MYGNFIFLLKVSIESSFNKFVINLILKVLLCIIFLEQSSNSEMAKNIKSFQDYIEKNRSLFDLEKIDQTRSIPLDVQNLTNDMDFKNTWPSFQSDLFENPETTLRILEYCLHEVKLKKKSHFSSFIIVK